MKKILYLFSLSIILAGCGLPYCRENRCCVYTDEDDAAEEKTALPEVKKEPESVAEPKTEPKTEPAAPPAVVSEPAKPAPVIKDDGKPFVIGATVFKYNAYDFTDEGKTNLDAVVKYMKDHPEKKVLIGGHTDSTGKAEYNLSLSKLRVKAVADYLVAAGIEKKRMLGKGFGETKPVASNKTAAGRAKNRRIEITFK